ncbi:transcription elongation factor GreA [Flavimobilis sp. GY10621]|uniref:Transcription elongation factor GreA n=1 Tax=Flavimobilis rhizosphaerae TaxID=2775421 RepID=A0ABR9DMB8_9MICO|nr:transcription elongation factor GreA [Flavimobilis rhizosphaerae]MBD9698282.1 transcription elongation factor GreA [Flavimobilis rhizosphaerae]
MTGTTTWLTQEAYDRLKAEYEYLTGAGRDEIVARVAQARDEGDLKENSGYHAAREEHAKQEARVRELKAKLENAQVGTPPDDGLVEPGMIVTLDFAGEEMTFLLGSREIVGTTELDVFSEASPLGASILGRSVGDEVTFTTPTGAERLVKVLKAVPYDG